MPEQRPHDEWLAELKRHRDALWALTEPGTGGYEVARHLLGEPLRSLDGFVKAVESGEYARDYDPDFDPLSVAGLFSRTEAEGAPR